MFSRPAISAPDGFKLGFIILQDAGDDIRDEIFGEFQQAGQIDKRDFGLDHPEFGEVSACFAFFGAEGGAEAIDLAEGRGGTFEVQLAGLCQEQGTAEVIDLEKRLLFLARRRHQYRGIDEREAIVVEEPSDGVDDRVADFADAPLSLRAKVQMAVFQEEIDAVFFWRDGVIGCGVNDLGVCNGQLETADAAVFLSDEAGYCQR